MNSAEILLTCLVWGGLFVAVGIVAYGENVRSKRERAFQIITGSALTRINDNLDDISAFLDDISALLDKGYGLHSNGSLEKENGAERLE